MDDEITKEQFEEVVKKCCWLNDISDPVALIERIHVEDAIPKGFNYSGRLLRIVANAKNQSGKEKRISVVLKRTPLNEDQSNFIAEHGLFLKETQTYDDVLSRMEEIIFSKGRNGELDWPRHFTINKYDSLLLQDLKECGYSTVKQRESTYEESMLVVQGIARLHAMSIILADKQKINTDSYKVNPMAQNNTIIDFVYIASLRAIIDAVRNTKQIQLYSYADAIESNLSKIEPALNQLVTDSAGSYDVLNHGDCWLNNIMFKYSSNNQPLSIKLIDFQLCYYNSLAWDLTHFIYCTFLRDNREKYKAKLISQYRSALVQALQLYGGKDKIETVPSEDEILRSIEKIQLFGLVVGLATIPRLVPGIESHLDLDITLPDHAHMSKTKLYSIPQVMHSLTQDFIQLNHVIVNLKK